MEFLRERKMINEYFEEVVNPYHEKNYSYGKGLILKKWDDSILRYIDENNIESIFINISRGWGGGADYSFLSKLVTIKALSMIVGESKNLSSIEKMIALESIDLTVNGKEFINFKELRNLKKCFISWWPKAASIFELSTLEELYVDNLKLKNYTNFIIQSKANKLTIGNSQIDNLNFLKDQQNLTVLNLFNCKKITNFSIISSCSKLKKIDLSGCHLKDLSFIEELKNLEVLIFADTGEIESLKAITNLKALKAIWFSGKTKILDGDLSPLTQLPMLSMVSFNHRQHYTHKVIKAWNWDDFNVPDSNILKAKP
jgi:Leucine-rich repeat (LRR) protein